MGTIHNISSNSLNQSSGKSSTVIPGAQADLRFDGPEYSPARDQKRLTGQLLRVFNLMRDGKWRTLAEIAVATGDPEGSISAQLRHLRKARFGGHTVLRERKESTQFHSGTFQYRLVVKDQAVSQ